MRKKIVRSFVEYLLFISVLQLFKLLPCSISKKLIVWLFLFIGLHIGVRKKIVLQQLETAFPQKSTDGIRQIRRALYKNLALTSWEMFTGDNSGQIDVYGWENIEQALGLKRGLIIISGHIGNWELAGRYIAKMGLPINVVIKRLRNPFFNDYVNHTRQKDGIKIIYKSKAMRPVLTALKNNEIIVMLIDQDAGRDGVALPFMNKKASVFTGFARLAERYNTPMVLGIALRLSNGRSRFIFEESVLPSELSKGQDRVIPVVKYFNSRLEHYVREYPEQWFWVHRRWKRVGKAKKLD